MCALAATQELSRSLAPRVDGAGPTRAASSQIAGAGRFAAQSPAGSTLAATTRPPDLGTPASRRRSSGAWRSTSRSRPRRRASRRPRSIRSAKRRDILVACAFARASRAVERIAEADLDVAGPDAARALREDRPHALEVDRDDRDAAALREIGGAAAELLAPAVGAPAALGEDHEAPAVFDELGGDVGALAVDPRALDRDRAERERRERRLPGPVEEVVGGRGDDGLVAKARRAARRARSPVSRWLVWLAAKITGPSSGARCSSP